jgi:integrase/recombinase XerD
MLSSLFPRAHARYASLPILGGVLDGFCEWLHAHGYPHDAIRRRMQVTWLLADALRRRRVRRLRQLTAPQLWSLAPKPTGWTAQLTRALTRSLMRYLEERGELASIPTTPTLDKIAAYRTYLVSVRGLAPATVAKHASMVSEFLHFIRYDAHPEKLHNLHLTDVEAFITQVGRRLGRASMQDVIAILRSLLRFLVAEGTLSTSVDTQIEAPRCFRQERLPRALPWMSVRSLLHSIDRSTPKGRRDYAILLMIATYGLRSGEIAALKLDDVSWRSRTLRVPRPKVGSPLSLPLTDEVATALLAYLRRGRPSSIHRELFLRARIPLGPIESTTVSDIFDTWAGPAGIRLPPRAGGPHCLRHSVAVHLLREGVSMKTIGDLLGHRSAESTCVYLRLQTEDLRNVALPLPTAHGREVPT